LISVSDKRGVVELAKTLGELGAQILSTGGTAGALTAAGIAVTQVASYTGAPEILAAFRRLSSIHVRNDIQRVFSDGNEVCVIYDFVTDTMGAMPTIEWLTIDDGKIAKIKLFYDQVPWVKIREEMGRRAASSSQARV